MSEKSISQYSLVTEVEPTDLVLIQRGDVYKSIEVTNLGNGLFNARINLTSSDILSINSTPVEIIAAQGAGTAVELLFASASLTFGTTAYTSAGNLRFKYIGDAEADFIGGFVNGFLTSASTVRHRANRTGVTNNEENENTGVEVFVNGSDPTLGDSTVVVEALFKIFKI
jgi:hypothetical protein